MHTCQRCGKELINRPRHTKRCSDCSYITELERNRKRSIQRRKEAKEIGATKSRDVVLTKNGRYCLKCDKELWTTTEKAKHARLCYQCNINNQQYGADCEGFLGV